MHKRWFAWIAGRSLFCLLLLGACFADAAESQDTAKFGGDYTGTIGPLVVKVHIVRTADGTLSATLDSPNQGAAGIPCTNVTLNGTVLSFDVPSVNGSFKGTIADHGDAIDGAWTQGNPIALKLGRDTFVAANKPSAVDGIWLGTLNAGGQRLRLQLKVRSDATGRESCEVDSLDQHAYGLPCADVSFVGQAFSFTIPSVKGSWQGTLSTDGNTLTGTWKQLGEAPLNLERQAAAIAASPASAPRYDEAMPPVSAADMHAVLRSDFKDALTSGSLAPKTHAGVSIGVLRNGERSVFAFGTARPDSLFEIGSITKTFTGLMFAQLLEQGKVKLDEPLRELLPPGTVQKPVGDEILLVDLVTQHSGLPRMPDNFKPADRQNPYVDYRAATLYEFLGKIGVQRPASPEFLYSNLGFGVLGQALANRAGVTYPQLLARLVTEPLCMKETVTALSTPQQSRFIEGYTATYQPAHSWEFDVLAGAGAIRSTASDMLIYLDAQLHPEHACKTAAASPAAKSLAASIERTHEPRAEAQPGRRIGFAWMYEPSTGIYLHNGGTGGYSSLAMFDPKEDFAVVVLVNRGPGADGGIVDRLGLHIGQRLRGKRALKIE